MSSSSGGWRRSASARGAPTTCCRSLRQALKDRCSLGEVCGAMRDVFGEYQPSF